MTYMYGMRDDELLVSAADLTLPAENRRHPRSLACTVVDQLTEEISSGRLAVGQKLPTEMQLVKGHGVSRTVVREAISRLQASGLVETRHGIGTFVLASGPFMPDMRSRSEVTISDVLSMLELRISLETEASGLAASRRTEQDLAGMKEAMESFLEQTEKGDSAVEADVNFHLLIARATGNRYFEETYAFMGRGTIPRIRVRTTQYVREPVKDYLMRIHAEHVGIWEAIARQDTDAARASMRLHLVNSRIRLRAALGENG